MPDDKIAMTKDWCDQVRHACSSQVKERYDAMKELFTSKLNGVSDQLATTLQDLQKSLSIGSARMSTIETNSKEQTAQLRQEIQKISDKVDNLYKTNDEHIGKHAKTFTDKLSEVEDSIEDIKKPPWQLISIVVGILIAIGGSMLLTWREVGVHDEKFSNVKEQILDLKSKEDKQIAEINEAIRILKDHIKNP